METGLCMTANKPLHQNSHQDFHTFLNVSQDTFVPPCTVGNWSFLSKTAFLF